MAQDRRRKIALIIAGGASLGSYEAGVLVELLYALDYLNRGAQSEQDKYVVDVITGGSAGALNAILLARVMLFDLPSLRRNIYNAWVKRIDMMKLMEDGPDNAILSKEIIRQIADDYVVKGSGDPDNRTRVASFAPEVLRLGLTLSNMNGIDYTIPYLFSTTPGDRAFISTTFSDTAHYKITGYNIFNESHWQAIANAAIASSSFPIIFQPESVPRTAKDYPNSEQTKPSSSFFPPSGTRPMTFLDGGIFNNEPLQDAIDLAKEIDGTTVDPERIFLLIDPSINRSEFEATIEPTAPLENHVSRLFTMILNESRAIEWLERAHKKNVELSWRNELVRYLSELISTSSISQDPTYINQVHQLTEQVVQQKRQLNSTDESDQDSPDLTELLQSVEAQFPKEYEAIAYSGGDVVAKQNLFKRLITLFNVTASLESKEILHLSVIGSIAERTAGDQISGFGGFFNEEWRQFDYRQGRIEAHNQLPRILGKRYPKEQINGQTAEDYRIPRQWNNFPNVTMEDADRDLREKLRGKILSRSAKVIGDALNVPLSGWLVSRVFIRPKVNDLLKL